MSDIILRIFKPSSIISPPPPAEASAQVLQPYYLEFNNISDTSGNEFDVIATITYIHATAASRTTELYYVGSQTWRAGFLAEHDGVGEWSWSITSSDSAILDGQSGSFVIEANDVSTRQGLSLIDSGKVVTTRANGSKSVVMMNTFQDAGNTFGGLGPHRSSAEFNLSSAGVGAGPSLGRFDFDASGETNFDAWMDWAETYGFNVLDVELEHQVFGKNVSNVWYSRYTQHSEINPSLLAFRILEDLLNAAHNRNFILRFFMWGDEQRFMTPIGLSGGINGSVDQRMQRYLCSRFGQYPNWFICYGYDLAEWVNSSQIDTWATYLNSHLGWPHITQARIAADNSITTPQPASLSFETNDHWMYTPVALDFDAMYDLAVTRLGTSGGRPVCFDRRFTYLRDSYWTMERTRDFLWAAAMAKPGGVTAVYGNENATTYPDTVQFETFHSFWNPRWTFDLVADNAIVTGGYALRNSANTLFIFFVKAGTSITIDLSASPGSLAAVRINVAAAYSEVDVGPLASSEHTLNFSSGDYAIAVGAFPESG